MTSRVLMIEDDLRLAAAVKKYLEDQGFEVRAESLPSAGLAAFADFSPHVVLLDLNLPEKSGFDVCREIRATSAVPILFFSARGEVVDRVVGLELGADDYLPKPIDPRELVARIRAALRRAKPDADGRVMRFGDLSVDVTTRGCALKGKAVVLSTTEFDVLMVLINQAGTTLSREQIASQLGMTAARETFVDVAISRLRRKLRDHADAPTFIRTVRGAGYLFIGK